MRVILAAIIGLAFSSVAQAQVFDADGLGVRVTVGGVTVGQRLGGPNYSYNRMGPYQFYRNSYGTAGTRYYDGYRGVQQFYYSNPRRGYQTYGQVPYPGNYYSPYWAVRVWQ